jgi:soluble lytic murein transglycosylase-like protein
MRRTLLLTLLWCLMLPGAGANAQTNPTLYIYEHGGETKVSSIPIPGKTPARMVTGQPSQLEATASIEEDKLPFVLLAIESATRHGLEPALVCAVIEVESSFEPMATSEKGAAGLMQITHHLWDEFELENPWEPRANIEVGTVYLARLLTRYHGKLDWALAAYNAGSGKVRAAGGPPSYTRDYILKVVRARERWRARLSPLLTR